MRRPKDSLRSIFTIDLGTQEAGCGGEVPGAHTLSHLQKKDPRHGICTLLPPPPPHPPHPSTCNMGRRVTHVEVIFLEALMCSRTQIGTQGAFIK